jgi:hypothetical protein
MWWRCVLLVCVRAESHKVIAESRKSCSKSDSKAVEGLRSRPSGGGYRCSCCVAAHVAKTAVTGFSKRTGGCGGQKAAKTHADRFEINKEFVPRQPQEPDVPGNGPVNDVIPCACFGVRTVRQPLVFVLWPLGLVCFSLCLTCVALCSWFHVFMSHSFACFAMAYRYVNLDCLPVFNSRCFRHSASTQHTARSCLFDHALSISIRDNRHTTQAVTCGNIVQQSNGSGAAL